MDEIVTIHTAADLIQAAADVVNGHSQSLRAGSAEWKEAMEIQKDLLAVMARVIWITPKAKTLFQPEMRP